MQALARRRRAIGNWGRLVSKMAMKNLRKPKRKTGIRSLVSQSNKPAVFKNSYEVILTGNVSGALGTGFGYSFKFDDIPDVTDIMGLYDQYKLLKVQVKYIPAWNVYGNASPLNVPMYVVFDPTNSSAPTSASEVLDYANLRTKSIANSWKMEFTPCMFQSIGVTSSNEYSIVKTSKFWLTNTDTLSRGLRIWVDPINNASSPIGRLIFTYYVSAKFQS